MAKSKVENNVLSISNGSQSIPISALRAWLDAQEKSGANIINIELEYGYYNSIDGINLSAETTHQNNIDYLLENCFNDIPKQITFEEYEKARCRADQGCWRKKLALRKSILC